MSAHPNLTPIVTAEMVLAGMQAWDDQMKEAMDIGEKPTWFGILPHVYIAMKAATVVDGNDGEGQTFQARVQPWLLACFGNEIAADRVERNHRFLEEALELVQATGCTRDEAHQLVDYVFDRPTGDPTQEVGGVMVTIAALCLARGLDMHSAGEDELARIWTKVEAIRDKHATKPNHGPMPGQVRMVRHKKRGSTYRVIGTALLQPAEPVGEPCAMVVYRDIDKGHLWIRPESEFDDGRFEEVTPCPAA